MCGAGFLHATGKHGRLVDGQINVEKCVELSFYYCFGTRYSGSFDTRSIVIEKFTIELAIDGTEFIRRITVDCGQMD